MEEYIVEGNISVKAVVMAKRREVYKIVCDRNKKDKDTSFILHRSKEFKIPIEYCDREHIDTLAQGKTHGGLLAYCGERKFQKLEDVLDQEELFLALIEGIEDPFNFGSILRTLYAAGCDGVILPPRNWASAASVVTKSSAGASEYINLFVNEDKEDLQVLKQKKISFLCAQRSDAMSLYEYTFPKKFCIAIGGEMRGLSKPILQLSDQNLFIPYRQDFRNAMSGASATAIFAFEVVRQKESK